MVDTKREIERKYEAAPDTKLPDLTKVGAVAATLEQGVTELDAVYYDTADLRLSAASITLRRRTGGADAGWHLKLPVAPDVRDEIQAPLSDEVPEEIAHLVTARVRGAGLVPVVRLRTARDVLHLVDENGDLLAELSKDTVHAQRLAPGELRTAAWDEIEVELADGKDPALLDAIDKKLRKAGLVRAASPSKLARALEETAPDEDSAEQTHGKSAGPVVTPGSAGAYILDYVREQIEAVLAYDPAVRRDLPDSVHQMRVATRRLRSAFKTYRKILDRTVTDPVGDELKWLAAELGVARDQEVLAARLDTRIAAVPQTLLLGPVRARLQVWNASQGSDSRRRAIATLDSTRYLDLLDTLDALLADPPLRKGAAGDPTDVIPKAITKDFERLAGRVEPALGMEPGEERDVALHEARKAAKRARYAGEAARPALGKPAKRFAKAMKSVQTLLGDHQDSVVARGTLRDLAIQAHAAGESAFTWGLLHGREESEAADLERELPGVWAKAAKKDHRTALTG
ncbi:CYTH and CHAD domain-containing protein [Streptomyces sp. AM8-1-1]|uniref:CYTH and CHAD domain-containing protein n=1 Tax=Streptomyces sp. AM8-1-1 TaxID=3075825 RepID=UPI0028C4FE3C|nr:CYTH and CHAD domain-containing protein [Streptomyces sp. AM8-1-1]WNO74577.1 CYTH and CHAD domain-containing protein [Streptomyces sp. AM8-1-1]